MKIIHENSNKNTYFLILLNIIKHIFNIKTIVNLICN